MIAWIWQVIGGLISASAATSIILTVGKKLIDTLLSVKLASYQQRLSSENQRELQVVSTQLSLMSERINRYSKEQFQAYNMLWSALMKLKMRADDLWELASTENIKEFVAELKQAKLAIESNMLLLEDDHLIRLLNLIERFQNFRVGKQKLINVKRIDDSDTWEIEHVITRNRQIRDDYTLLIQELKSTFRSQIHHDKGYQSPDIWALAMEPRI